MESSSTLPGNGPVESKLDVLRRPFLPEAVKFKVQTASEKGALIVAYIDARHVAERLNATFPLQWSDEYVPLIVDGYLMGMECSISIELYDEAIGTHRTITRTDVGTTDKLDAKGRGGEKKITVGGSKGMPGAGMGGAKILYSDAFKRAGVKFGIGAFLYSLPSTWLSPDHLTGRSPYWKIPDSSLKRLQATYRAWLNDTGSDTFGEPLDHGDMDGSQGDVDISDKTSGEESVD